MKKPTWVLLLLASLLAACQNQTTPTTTSEGLEESLVENVSSDAQDDTTAVVSEYYGTYKEEDFEIDYDEASATTITFGTTTEISGEGATIDGNLVTFLLGVALACSALYTFYNHLVGEYRTSVLVLFLFHLYEIELYTILLAPLYEFALEVDLLVSHLVDVDHL